VCSNRQKFWETKSHKSLMAKQWEGRYYWIDLFNLKRKGKKQRLI